MFQELLWVHSAIRRDLEIVEKLAAEVSEGLPGEALQDALGELETTGPLWQLKMNCLNYCGHVHAHHSAENVLLMMPHTEIEGAVAVARRIQGKINKSSFKVAGHEAHPTISVGLASVVGDKALSLGDLVKSAARALASAVKAGGNRILFEHRLAHAG